MRKFGLRIGSYGFFVVALLLTGCAAAAQKQEPPEPAPLAKVDFPAYEKRILDNGLTVYALEQHEQPIVALRLLINVGAANDPKDLAGVASFAADLLSQGTRTRTATQIAEAIEHVGGTLEAKADMESTTVSAAVLTGNVGLAFELMTDIVMNPIFAPEEIARLQQKALSGLAAAMEDPDFIADAVLQRAIYSSHPYGQQESGTLGSIPGIRREHLLSFHETYYAPNISALAIAGDLSASDAFKLAEQWLGRWRKKDVPLTALADVQKPEGRRIVIVDKPDAVQTEIRMGLPTVRRKDPDYFNVLIMSLILGGSSSGRLNQKLRAEHGLTYGAFASIHPHKGIGDFYVLTETRTEKTLEALNLISEELGKVGAAKVPSAELQEAKSFIIGSFPLTIETPADLASRLTTVFLYDLGDDYLKTYRDRLAAVSAADVLRVAKAQVSPQYAAIVLVGHAAAFRKDLEPLGNVEVIPIDELKLDSPSLR